MESPEYLSWRRLQLSKSKLSNAASLAAILAQFSLLAMVELNIEEGDASPGLIILYVVSTALLAGTAIVAIMISNFILPHIEAVARISRISDVNRSPHDKMSWLIDLSWVLANTVSIFLFTLDVILVTWVKFSNKWREASICATLIMTPVLIAILLFGIMYYRKIMDHRYSISNKKCLELDHIKENIERQISYAHSLDTYFSRTSTFSLKSPQMSRKTTKSQHFYNV